VIVVDSSVVVAILLGEPESGALLAALNDAPRRLMSVANYVETGTVLAARRIRAPHAALADLDAFLEVAGIELVAADEAQGRVALEARVRFGRGMGHGGMLNFGDCFAYALARQQAVPLLFTGEDFHQTDIQPALARRTHPNPQ
jgi:ribonuclease VapC